MAIYVMSKEAATEIIKKKLNIKLKIVELCNPSIAEITVAEVAEISSRSFPSSRNINKSSRN
jgi:uncharacterized protein (DUF39 family)